MKRYILGSLFVLLASVSWSQNPGYLGKHFNAYFLLEPSFALRSDLEYAYSPTQDYVGQYGLEITPGFGAEYTVSKSVTMGLNFRFVSNKVMVNTYYNTFESSIHPPTYIGETLAKAMMTGIYAKFYSFNKRGFIAPVGKYHQLEILFGRSHLATYDNLTPNSDAMISDYDVYYIGNEYYLEDVVLKPTIEELGFDDKLMNIALRYTYGVETILFDKVPVEYGMYLGLPITYLQNRDYFGSETSQLNYDATNYSGIGSTMFLGLDFKVGFLAF